ncbi:MAG TPA: macro domain-containing protein [Egibacteraceae bacterium]|nr:macro domain-containing protein [Egibacteraceae bacterium]
MDEREGTEVARRDVQGRAVVVVEGDLTAQQVGAVVNAANEQLQHGGGVAAALAKAGGPAVQSESDAWVAEHGELRPGQAAVTSAGDLPTDLLVHVVGPRYRNDQDNEGLLRQAVHAALDAARDAGAGSVALPALSAGVFGYPQEQATAVIAAACRGWLARSPGDVAEIRLVGYDAAAARDFAEALQAA